jgi:hypothetical protein
MKKKKGDEEEDRKEMIALWIQKPVPMSPLAFFSVVLRLHLRI